MKPDCVRFYPILEPVDNLSWGTNGHIFSTPYWREFSESIFLRVSFDPIFLPDFLAWRVPLPALPKALPDSSACYCYSTSNYYCYTVTVTVPTTATATAPPTSNTATVPPTTATATVFPLTTCAGQSWAGQQSGLGCLYFPQTPTRRLEYYVLTITILSFPLLCPHNYNLSVLQQSHPSPSGPDLAQSI